MHYRVLLIILLLNLLTACSTLTRPQASGPMLTVDNAVAILPAAGLPTTIKVEVERPFNWWGIREGARRGIANCNKMRVSGGKEALYQLLICYPLSGMVGAVMGFADRPVHQPVEMDELEHFFGEGRSLAEITSALADNVREAGIEVTDQRRNLNTPHRRDVEIWLRGVNMQALAVGQQIKVMVSMDLQVRLFDIDRGKPLADFAVTLDSQPRSYDAWIRDDFARIKLFIRSAADELSRQLLL